MLIFVTYVKIFFNVNRLIFQCKQLTLLMQKNENFALPESDICKGHSKRVRHSERVIFKRLRVGLPEVI